mgnify:FL=1
MSLSSVAASLVDAGIALVRDNGPEFVAALKAHDWKTVAVDAVVAELTLAAAAGLPGAAIALKLVPVAAFISNHPADPASPAMSKATGGDGGQNIASGA